MALANRPVNERWWPQRGEVAIADTDSDGHLIGYIFHPPPPMRYDDPTLSAGGDLLYYGPANAGLLCGIINEIIGHPSLHYVYCLVDWYGELLYVGRTNDPVRRLRQHQQYQPWWPDVDKVAIYYYYRDAVGQAEELCIKMFNPIHNIAFKVP